MRVGRSHRGYDGTTGNNNQADDIDSTERDDIAMVMVFYLYV